MPVNITPDYSNLLALLDRPIAFHRVFVTVTGGVLPALMLSQAVYWHPRGSAEDNWFYKSQAEWGKETGMSRYEQEGARKRLKQVTTTEGVPVWEEELRGLPARLYYRVNVTALFECILGLPQYAEIPHTSMRDTNTLAGDNPAYLPGENPQSLYTENTTDIRAKNGKRPTRAQRKRSYQPEDYDF
jgi:hypothetical protein